MKCSHFYLPQGFGWERKTKTYLCFKLKRFIVLSDEHNHHRNSFWNCIFISISVVYTYRKTRLWVNWCIFFYSKVLFQTTIPYQIHGNDRDTKERFHQHDFLVKKRSVKITVFLLLNYQMEKLCPYRFFPNLRRCQNRLNFSLFVHRENNNKSSRNGTAHYLAPYIFQLIKNNACETP